MADIDELSSDSDDEEYIPEGTQPVNSKHNGHLNGNMPKSLSFLIVAHQHSELLTFV